MAEIKKEPVCPAAKKCGGCQLTNMTYAEQLSFKMAKCIRLLGKYGKVSEIATPSSPYHYRNKVQAAFGKTRGGEIISGVYQSGSHSIVRTESCLIEDEKADEVIVTVRKLLKSFGLGVYDENTGRGFLRHVLVKRSEATKQLMIVLVTGKEPFKYKNDFVSALIKAHPETTTIVHNINDKFTSMVLGDSEAVLYGDGYITDELCGMKFRISPKSFYQVNHDGAEYLYNTALSFAEIKNTDRVIDAYSGVGTIGLIASKAAGEVISVELNPDAVSDAKKNAALNNVKNIRFFRADATPFLYSMAEEGEKADVVIMDPPRAGSTVGFMKSVCALAPEKVVYVSCSPETLCRDLNYFVTHNYKVRKIQPVDMFPHTSHVETVVLMSKRLESEIKNVQKRR